MSRDFRSIWVCFTVTCTLVAASGATTDVAQKRALITPLLIENHSGDTRFVSQPDNALSCSTPCTANSLRATQPFYELLVDCVRGRYSALTGVNHPATVNAGAAQSVLYDGALNMAGSEVMLHVYNNASDYSLNGGSSCVFNPPDTPLEPMNVGLETERTFSAGAGMNLILRHEVVAFGTSGNDAGIRFTLEVTNRTTSTVDVGVGLRWFLDLQNADDDGPARAKVDCNPQTIGAEATTEHDLLPAEIGDFMRLLNNDTSEPIELYLGTSPVAGVADTAAPDRLVYGWWSNMYSVPLGQSPWGYAAFELDTADDDAVVLFYHGANAAAVLLDPGQSWRRSIVYYPSCSPSVGCTAPTGTIANDLRAIKNTTDVAMSWPTATLNPANARVFRTEDRHEVVETPTGIGDELVLANVAVPAASDPAAVTAANSYYYEVLPVDSCSATIYP